MFGGVVLAGLLGVVRGLDTVATGDFTVLRSLLVVPGLVLRRGLLVVLGGLPVVLGFLVHRHDFSFWFLREPKPIPAPGPGETQGMLISTKLVVSRHPL